MKVIGHRLLIRPDEPPQTSAGGLVLPQDRDHVPVSGTVVSCGDGPARDQRIRSASIARCISIVEELAEMGVHGLDVIAELRRYKNTIERYDGVQVGDRVVYPIDAGLSVTEDGAAYILLNEDDVVIIADDASVAA